jgi:hypothetical protein
LDNSNLVGWSDCYETNNIRFLVLEPSNDGGSIMDCVMAQHRLLNLS